ncbi:MAG: hypothetical protein OXM55_00685 [Bdellovibrionales bacterium]|nr:hypothetical protein [Bdellovibrionales bacterium]
MMPLSPEKEIDIKKDLLSFLKAVVQDKRQHTHWLNTLAFMEHIGSRKIIKSQDSTKLDHFVLQHISEEARHAFYFKNLAHKLSPSDCPTFEDIYLIKGSASEDYFQAIDHKAEKNLTDSPSKNILNYLYTTWLIEERALMLYELYNQVLKSNKLPFNLNAILREEDHHLKTVIQIIQKKDLDFKERATRLFDYEKEAFSSLVKEWLMTISDRG